MIVSENDEESENYAVQDNEILNTKEATANFCTESKARFKLLSIIIINEDYGQLGR